MELSYLLAKFWGIFMGTLCLILILNKKSLTLLIEISKNDTFNMLSGFVSFMLGLITILIHNVWTNDWRTAVTLIGWIALIKGIVRIWNPKLTGDMITKMNGPVIKIIILLGLVGSLYLVYVGYGF